MKTRRAATITLEIPQNPIPEIFEIVHDFASESTGRGQEAFSKIQAFFQNKNSKNKIKSYLPVALLGVIVIIALVFVGRFVISAISGQTLGATDSRVEIKGPKAKISLDKTYKFPLMNDKGKEVATLKFFLDDAELRDEIILGGQKAVLVKGRTYLIITIKLTNNSNKFIQMKVRNYARLSVNDNKEDWAAAQVYNDPVEVQPESTLLTRLGFPINDTDKDLVLRVGDLDGKKENIPLNF